MQQTLNKPPKKNGSSTPHRSTRQFLATRQGMVTLALVVAVVGAGAILVFLQQYRDSLKDETKPITVLVAKEVIGKGTSGDLVASDGLFQATEISEGDAKEGAITDPGSLRGRVATTDVFPGEQLTSEAFATGGSSVESSLSGSDRAIAIPVDPAHGLIGVVNVGDRVDVLAGFVVDRGDGRLRPVMRVLVQDALVLKADADSGSGSRSSSARKKVIIRANDRQAAAIAFAADNGKLWVTLRPPSRGEQSRPAVVTVDTLLTGLKPLILDPRGADR